MAVNWKILNVEDFRIFSASDDIIEETNRRKAQLNAANEQWVAEHPAPQPKMRISGSFIYAQPPNYKGLTLLHASEEEWLLNLARLKKCGVDTVIFQAAVWNELETCYYPSKHFASYKCFDSLGKMLSAAEKLNLHVFLGGYGSVAGWHTGSDPAIVQREKDAHFATLDELFQLYGGRFEGIYFAPETAYRGQRDLQAEAFLNAIYRGFCDRLKQNAPQCQILMSPATKYYEGKLDEMEASWNALLDGVQLDIMAPQDSIGCGGLGLSEQKYTYPLWKKICQHHGIRFWSNIELFEGHDCSLINPSLPARPSRIAAQIAAAAPYAEKLICWEMLYFANELMGPRAAEVQRFLEAL